jgi:hypothetical protein
MGSVIRMFQRDVDRRRPDAPSGNAREICYRYPADEEISEVSCGPEPHVTAPKPSPDRRRAS